MANAYGYRVCSSPEQHTKPHSAAARPTLLSGVDVRRIPHVSLAGIVYLLANSVYDTISFGVLSDQLDPLSINTGESTSLFLYRSYVPSSNNVTLLSNYTNVQ